MIRVLAIVILTALSSPGAMASSATPPVDPLVARLRSRVWTVTQPFHVYHWGLRARLGALGAGPVRSDDPMIARSVLATIDAYIGNESRPDAFYAAVDPVSSRSFGGDPTGREWFLVRVEVPVGFRVLDIVPRSGDDSLTQDLGACPRDFLVDHASSRECATRMRMLVRALDVDAVYYPYGYIPFQGCRRDPQGAFIFTTSGRLSPLLIRAFTSDTPDAAKERRLIQAAFVRAPETVSRFYRAQLEQLFPNYASNPSVVDDLRKVITKYPRFAPLGNDPDRVFHLSHDEFMNIALTELEARFRKEVPAPPWTDRAVRRVNEGKFQRWLRNHLLPCGDFGAPRS